MFMTLYILYLSDYCENLTITLKTGVVLISSDNTGNNLALKSG